MYEEFARQHPSEEVQYARYKGAVNESAGFNTPEKLPAILLFRKKDGTVERMEDIEELLVKTAKEEDVHRRIEEFVRKNKKQ